MMSKVHCSPEDAVEVHVDVKSKKSVGESLEEQLTRRGCSDVVQ